MHEKMRLQSRSVRVRKSIMILVLDIGVHSEINADKHTYIHACIHTYKHPIWASKGERPSIPPLDKENAQT